MDITSFLEEEPLNRVAHKKDNNIRYVTFNVNGAKTLFNYFPWNKFQQSFDAFFKLLNADIISLQELKVSPQNISQLNISNIKEYKSFISLPKEKKGYSGVGLFVRKPKSEESSRIKDYLQVIKAEEGITGCLNSNEESKVKYRDLNDSSLIGGYDFSLDNQEGLRLDSEGRCVVIELACNMVVFSVYCPANSIGTEDGENFRMKFLRVLLERCYRLKYELKKEIIILGDINVSLDLIDNADEINNRMKQGLLQPYKDGYAFESNNFKECINFKKSKTSRMLLNEFVYPTITGLSKSERQFLYDTTRYNNNRTMGLYTVWNTLNGARQTNYGSRIDLILASSENLVNNISNSGIWPFIQGSDHCPAFTDFQIIGGTRQLSFEIPKSLPFEAKNFFNLVRHHDISHIFKKGGSTKRKNELSNPLIDLPKRKLIYKSRKNSSLKAQGQSSISHFFREEVPHDKLQQNDNTEAIIDTEKKKKSLSISNISELIYGKPPLCNHGLPCQMKTSLNNSKSRGKKYWCCSKSRAPIESISNEDASKYQCSYFEWASKP